MALQWQLYNAPEIILDNNPFHVCFGGLFVWVISRLAGDWPMSPPVPKGPQSSSFANYRPISITSVLSKVFECLVFVRLGRFMERNGVLPTTKFAYRKGLATCDALLFGPHTLPIKYYSSVSGGLRETKAAI